MGSFHRQEAIRAEEKLHKDTKCMQWLLTPSSLVIPYHDRVIHSIKTLTEPSIRRRPVSLLCQMKLQSQQQVQRLTGGDESWLLELHVGQGLLVVEHAGVEDGGCSSIVLLDDGPLW